VGCSGSGLGCSGSGLDEIDEIEEDDSNSGCSDGSVSSFSALQTGSPGFYLSQSNSPQVVFFGMSSTACMSRYVYIILVNVKYCAGLKPAFNSFSLVSIPFAITHATSGYGNFLIFEP